MSSLPDLRVSRTEYLRRERAAEFRSEYHGGLVVAMSGAARKHNRIVTNLTMALGNQLKGRACNNYSNDMRVSVRGGESYFYPDVVVTCGPEEFEDGEVDTLVNPVVVIEVLSTSTEGYDRGRKFLSYQTVRSLREYVLITPHPPRFEIYRKRSDNVWEYESLPFMPVRLTLESVECVLTSEDVWDKVEPEPSAPGNG